MALVNSQFEMVDYVNDFGVHFANVKFKISDKVGLDPLIAPGYYQLRVPSACPTAANLRVRKLIVCYSDGSKIEFPCPSQTDITGMYNILKDYKPSVAGVTLTAITIALKGEEYGYLTNKAVGTPLTFDTTNTKLALGSTSKKTSYTYDYQSDAVSGLLHPKLAVTDHTEGDTYNLAEIQIGCMTDPKTNQKGPCSTAALGITPRHLVLVHASSTTNSDEVKPTTVVRTVPISSKSFADAKTCSVKTALKSLCLKYQGESIKNLENLL
jgi:hypothetical protein